MGSAQPATADPPVARPPTKPIRVLLFAHERFDNYSAHPFEFTPPRRKGPWAKIVLVAEFRCTAGVQYDRTCTVFLGNTNIFFGTTQEPGATTSPVWHVERDLTDYAPLFAKSEAGAVSLGNIVDKQLTGVYLGSAALMFYPAGEGTPASSSSYAVISLNSENEGLSLPDAKTALAAAITFPQNTIRVYLDATLQGQAGDEFWYLGVPDSVKDELQSSGGTGFREGEVSIDGQPADVVPIYPWIYTGGIDPLWWRPIPGVQAYNLAPYRIDLTPFAGLLADGRPHTIAVRVYGNTGSFTAAGALLVYTDPGKRRVTGGLAFDTLGQPAPAIAANLHRSTLGEVGGPVEVDSRRGFSIEGWVETSRGRVDTRIDEQVVFTNRQFYAIGPGAQSVDLAQDQRVSVRTTMRQPGRVSVSITDTDWPLAMLLSDPSADTAGARMVHTVDMGIRRREADRVNGKPAFHSALSDTLWSSDTAVFEGRGRGAKRNPRSRQTYVYSDSKGGRWRRTVESAGMRVTSVK